MVIVQIWGVGCSLGRRSLGWGFCYLSWSSKVRASVLWPVEGMGGCVGGKLRQWLKIPRGLRPGLWAESAIQGGGSLQC